MYKRFFKRFIDIIFSLIAMPFYLLILIILAPITYFQDKGSVFYNAMRLGKDGKIFKMYKFRTMKLNAPDIRNADGSTYNAEDDPRLTPIGKFIRRLSIDEVPQILNILKGDMSLIGPRPDLPEHIEMYENDEYIKLSVRPGITGYNQAYFRNSAPWKLRLKNDIYYVNNLSFLFDIRIFFKTIISVLFHKSIYANNEINYEIANRVQTAQEEKTEVNT